MFDSPTLSKNGQHVHIYVLTVVCKIILTAQSKPKPASALIATIVCTAMWNLWISYPDLPDPTRGTHLFARAEGQDEAD